jgi:hypothetical protein
MKKYDYAPRVTAISPSLRMMRYAAKVIKISEIGVGEVNIDFGEEW